MTASGCCVRIVLSRVHVSSVVFVFAPKRIHGRTLDEILYHIQDN